MSIRINAPVLAVGVNVAVFVILRLIAAVLHLTGSGSAADILPWVEMPAGAAALARVPWTVVTYMFSQFDAMHLIVNMLILYWVGSLYCAFCGQRRFWWLYFSGGLCGALVFMALYALPGVDGADSAVLVGSSASVFALLTATALKMPRMRVNLFLLGEVELRWIAVAFIAIDFVIGLGGENVGGHIAHLGGVAAGAMSVWLRRPALRLRPLRRRRQAPRVHTDAGDEAELNAILDKIKSSGYGGLTDRERRRLFEISSRIK